MRLQRLIDDLFTLLQAETAGLSLKLAATDLAPVIRRRVEALAPLAWDRDRIELVTDVPATLPAVCVDEGRFERILTCCAMPCATPIRAASLPLWQPQNPTPSAWRCATPARASRQTRCLTSGSASTVVKTSTRVTRGAPVSVWRWSKS